ncbi:hypothetical protein BBO_03339 [Beauveria brongniartii RCEF 3172]|uniref:Uncharacterized protein n=1 Tax=Beauveria brongniartii RCEF 3172 TaxID=1081107 RepID=A0A167GLA3_9HYPO|nr:hypothetical protein BBO_03339 [Beauveria brongniartii RCEF 3172]
MKLSAALATAVLATTTTALPAVAEAVAEAAAAVLAATTTALPAVAEAAAAPARKNWGMPIVNHAGSVPDPRRRSTPELDKVTTSDNEEDDDDDLDGFGSPVKRRGDDDEEEDGDDDDDLDDDGSGSATHHRRDDDQEEDDDDDDLDDDGSGSSSAEHHRRDGDDHDYDLDGFYSVERRAGRSGGNLARPKPIALTLTHPKTITDDGRGVEKSDFENFGEELMRRAGRHRPIVDHTPVERRGADAGKPVADAFWGMPVVDHVPVPDTRREVAAAELESRREPFPIVDHQPVEP